MNKNETNTLWRERTCGECAWRQDEYTGAYHTACGHMWQFTEGDIADNDTRYCPYCGGLIVEQLTEGEEEPNPNTYRKILGAHPDLPDLEHNRQEAE